MSQLYKKSLASDDVNTGFDMGLRITVVVLTTEEQRGYAN
jgi:hypothetical protein